MHMQIHNHVSEARQIHFINEALRFRWASVREKYGGAKDLQAAMSRLWGAGDQGISGHLSSNTDVFEANPTWKHVPLEPGGATSIKNILYISVYGKKHPLQKEFKQTVCRFWSNKMGSQVYLRFSILVFKFAKVEKSLVCGLWPILYTLCLIDPRYTQQQTHNQTFALAPFIFQVAFRKVFNPCDKCDIGDSTPIPVEIFLFRNIFLTFFCMNHIESHGAIEDNCQEREQRELADLTPGCSVQEDTVQELLRLAEAQLGAWAISLDENILEHSLPIAVNSYPTNDAWSITS